jgi:citrate lyase subunit beta/citryl-CoA lyase
MIFDNLENIPTTYGKERKEPSTNRSFRSNMMLNPLRLKHLNRMDELEADVITINLEDAIAPSRKKEALHNTALFLSYTKQANSQIVVRVNPLNEGGAEEIVFLNDFAFDAVRVPKVRTVEEVRRALGLLSSDKELHVSLETKEAFYALASLRVDSRFTTVNLGILDLLNSLGLPQSLVKQNNPTIDYILSKFLVDAKTAGLHPVSFMFQEYKDTKTFEAWCEREKMMGFTSKACMGPAQVEIANRIFGTDEAAIKRAKHIKHQFELMGLEGEHGFMDDQYGFIDEPIYKDALLVLEKAGEL